MAYELRKDFFNYGELSKAMQAAPTTESYTRGLAVCLNSIVKPEGGVTNRAGTRFVADFTSLISVNPETTRIFPFAADGGQDIIYIFTETEDPYGNPIRYLYAYYGSTIQSIDLDPLIGTAGDNLWDVISVIDALKPENIVTQRSGTQFLFGITQYTTFVAVPSYDVNGLVNNVTVTLKYLLAGTQYLGLAGGTPPAITVATTVESGKEGNSRGRYVFTVVNAQGEESAAYPLVPTALVRQIVNANMPKVFDIANFVSFELANLPANTRVNFYFAVGEDDASISYLGTFLAGGSTDKLIYLGQPTDPSRSYPTYISVNGGVHTSHYRSLSSCLMQQRLVLGGFGGSSTGGIGADPQALNRVGFSHLGQPFNFSKYGKQATEAYPFSIDLVDAGVIRHLIGHKRLLVFSDNGTYSVSGEDEGSISPASIIPGYPNNYICDPDVRPVISGSSVMFVTKAPAKLMKTQYVREVNGYEFNDISTPSIDMVRRGTKIKRMAANDSLYGTVWCLHVNIGEAFATPISREVTALTNVPGATNVGFHRHDFGGEIVDINTLNDPSGASRTYILIRRRLNGAYVYNLEYLMNREIIESAADVDPLVYHNFVDSLEDSLGTRADAYSKTATLSQSTGWEGSNNIGLAMTSGGFASQVGNVLRFQLNDVKWDAEVITYNSATDMVLLGVEDVPTEFRGAVPEGTKIIALRNFVSTSRFINTPITVIGDGRVLSSPYNDDFPTITPSSGTTGLDGWFDLITIGLPYVSDVKLMRYVNLDKKFVDLKKKVLNVDLILQNSRGIFVASTDPESSTSVQGMEQIQALDSNLDRDYLDGIYNVLTPGNDDRNGQLLIRQVDPYPFTLLSVSPTIEE